MKLTFNSAWLYRIGVSAGILIVFAFGLSQTNAHLDDAYITYRYASNLARGYGFVYNRGESALGTTAPLYGLLLAVLGRLGLDIPAASHGLSVVGWALCVVWAAQIGATLRDRGVGLVAAACMAVSPLFLQVIGMETNLMLALSLGAVCLYLANHTHWAFLLAALATWMRPDCVLVAGVMGLAYLWERRRLPWREALIFVAALAPWLIFAQATYGAILPNSLFAKAGQGRSAMGGGEFGTFGWGLARLAANAFSTNKLYALMGLLSLVGLGTMARQRPRWSLIVVWAMLYTTSYIVLGVIPFTWYFLPVWPAMAFLVAGGFVFIVRWLDRRLARRWLTWGVAAGLGCLIVLPQIDTLRNVHSTTPSAYNRGYHAIADWLRVNTPRDASVAMIEIGIIGYYSDRQVVDTMGLVSPDMLGHLSGWNQTVLYAVGHYWPDYVVALRGTAWDYVTPLAWFGDAYRPVARIPSAGPASRSATIYQRAPGFPVRDWAWNRSFSLTVGEIVGLSAIHAQTMQLRPDQPLRLQIEWAARKKTSDDIKVTLDLVNAHDGKRWPMAIEQPMRGGNPTFLWRPGEVVLDNYALSLPTDLEQGPYVLEVKLLDVTRDTWLDFSDARGKPIPHMSIGPLWLGATEQANVPVAHPLHAMFDDSIELTGFDLSRANCAAGEPMSLTLYWRATRAIEEDYTVFVHIVNALGELVAQQDNPPAQGNLPTSLWATGVTVRDSYQIAPPTECSSGEHTIRIGLYKASTGERLLPQSPDQPVVDRALQLVQVKW